MYVCTYVRRYVRRYAGTYVRTYVYMYVYTYIYIYIHSILYAPMPARPSRAAATRRAPPAHSGFLGRTKRGKWTTGHDISDSTCSKWIWTSICVRCFDVTLVQSPLFALPTSGRPSGSEPRQMRRQLLGASGFGLLELHKQGHTTTGQQALL